MINAGTGNDTVQNTGTGMTISGGKGDDSIVSSNKGNSIDAGDGNNTILGGLYLTIKSDSGDDYIDADQSIIDAGDGNNTIDSYGGTIKTGSGDDYIQGGNSIEASNGNNTIFGGDNIKTGSGDDFISLSSSSESDFGSIDAGNGNNTIIGNCLGTIQTGSGKDFISLSGNHSSINSGAGNDTILNDSYYVTLSGGKGADVFIYNGGINIITDYETKDKISLASAYASYRVEGSDIMFDFGGEGNYLTIKNSAGKVIKFNSFVKSYTTDGSFDKDKKAVMLQSTTKNFSAKEYSNLASIDGSETGAASITGNNKANIIIAGKYGSTIAGGKGKDSIYANDGADVFVYDKGDGKDTIYNYGEGDKISLGSNATIKDAKIKKDSAVFKIGSGSITVNSLTSGISFNDTIFSNGIFISETAKVLGSFSGTINLGDLEF